MDKVMRKELEEWKVRKDLAKDRNAWKSFIENVQTMQAWKTDAEI